MVDHERTVMQDVFVRDHHAFGIASRPRCVLEKQNPRSAVKRFVRNGVDEVLRDNPTKTGNIVHIHSGGADSASGKIGLKRSEVVLARKYASRLAVLRDMDHLVEGALEV